eukprot:TRINITY_DN29127_c0_g1_i1.p1 TRINITY_DN29127_c0_g1~~TRINITY_DN29127_c0_g1_i1.p1  ORF type:complete len:140 (-),score=22.75 TRINITY_DN29127_c0_g1_i1:88-507(-)
MWCSLLEISRVTLREAVIGILKEAQPNHRFEANNDSCVAGIPGKHSSPLTRLGIAACLSDIILKHGPRTGAGHLEEDVIVAVGSVHGSQVLPSLGLPDNKMVNDRIEHLLFRRLQQQQQPKRSKRKRARVNACVSSVVA